MTALTPRFSAIGIAPHTTIHSYDLQHRGKSAPLDTSISLYVDGDELNLLPQALKPATENQAVFFNLYLTSSGGIVGSKRGEYFYEPSADSPDRQVVRFTHVGGTSFYPELPKQRDFQDIPRLARENARLSPADLAGLADHLMAEARLNPAALLAFNHEKASELKSAPLEPTALAVIVQLKTMVDMARRMYLGNGSNGADGNAF